MGRLTASPSGERAKYEHESCRHDQLDRPGHAIHARLCSLSEDVQDRSQGLIVLTCLAKASAVGQATRDGSTSVRQDVPLDHRGCYHYHHPT